MSRKARAAVVAFVAAAVAGTSVGVASAMPTEPGSSAGAQSGRLAAGRVLVQFRADVSAADQAATEHGQGARALGGVNGLGVKVLEVPAGAEQRVIDALRNSGRVVYAERDGVATTEGTPNDYWWPRQWSPVKVNAPQAWDRTTGSSSVVVAVLDTGVTPQADLQGKLTAGYDFVNNDADPADDHGHGTMAAGVVGAVSNNSVGVASLCWSCTVMPVKVMGADGNGTYSAIASGITWAADHGAKVISLSLSGTATSTTLQSAIDYAYGKGAVITAAAGNTACNCVSYPAAYPHVLGVAATDASDALATYSNFGSWVKVAAPGSNYTTTYTGGYTSFAGTSSATPVVAGIAGLAFSAGATTNTQVMDAITGTAAKVGTFVASGRVDAAATLAALTDAPAPSPSASTSPTSSPAPSSSPSPSPSTAPSPSSSPSPSPTTSPSASPTPAPSTSPTAAPSPSPTPTKKRGPK